MTSVTITFGESQTSFQYNMDYDEFMRQVQSTFSQLPKDTWKLIYEDEDKDLIQIWNQWDFYEMLKEKNTTQISLILVQDQSQHEQEINEQRQVEQQLENSQNIREKQLQYDVEENIEEKEVQQQKNIFRQSNKETVNIRQVGVKHIYSQDKNDRQSDKNKSRPEMRQNFELEASDERSKQNDQIQNEFDNEDTEQICEIRQAPRFEVENLIDQNQPGDDDRPIYSRKDNGQLQIFQQRRKKIQRKSSAQELKQIQSKLNVFTTSFSDDHQIFQFNQEQLFVILLCHITIKKYRNKKFKDNGGYDQLRKFLDSMGIRLGQIKHQRFPQQNSQKKEITNQIHQPNPSALSQETTNQVHESRPNTQLQETTNQIHQPRPNAQLQETTNQIHQPIPNTQTQETTNQVHESRPNTQLQETTNQIHEPRPNTQLQETTNQIHQPIPNTQTQETTNQVHESRPNTQLQETTNEIHYPRPNTQTQETTNQIDSQIQVTLSQVHASSPEITNQMHARQQETTNQTNEAKPNAQQKQTAKQIHEPKPNAQYQQVNQIHEQTQYVQPNQTQKQVHQSIQEQVNRQKNLPQEPFLQNVNQNKANKIKQPSSTMQKGQSTSIAISKTQCNRIQSGLELLVSQVDSLSKQISSLQQSLFQLNKSQHSDIQLGTKSKNMPHQYKQKQQSEIKLCKSCKANADVVYLQAIYLCHKCQNYLSINCKPRPVNQSESSNPIIPQGNQSHL